MKLKEFLNEKELPSAYDENKEFKLKKLGFKKYKKLEDGSYEVWGSYKGNPKDLPIKIKIIHGSFNCSEQKLKSLEGCPEKVDGDFYCSHNDNLTSLKGAPKEVGDDFNCKWCNLKSLKYAPKKVGGNFNCNENNLIDLEGSPKIIEGNFNCSHNKLETLKGGPEFVDAGFICSFNKLDSLKYAPKFVGGDFICYRNSREFMKKDFKFIKVGREIDTYRQRSYYTLTNKPLEK